MYQLNLPKAHTRSQLGININIRLTTQQDQTSASDTTIMGVVQKPSSTSLAHTQTTFQTCNLSSQAALSVSIQRSDTRTSASVLSTRQWRLPEDARRDARQDLLSSQTISDVASTLLTRRRQTGASRGDGGCRRRSIGQTRGEPRSHALPENFHPRPGTWQDFLGSQTVARAISDVA